MWDAFSARHHFIWRNINMHKYKKPLSILLTVLLLLTACCFPFSVSAAEDSTGQSEPAEILSELIAQADTILTTDTYVLTDAERQTLTQTLADAKEVAQDASATEDDQLLACGQLIAAMESPVYRSMTAQVKAQYINMLDLISYTLSDSALEAMHTVLALCDTVLAQETVTEEDFFALLANITEVSNTAGEITVTKEDLGTLLKKAEVYMDPTRYTTDSYTFFSEAYAQAQGVYNDDLATPEDIDLAFSSLLLSILSMQERPVPTMYGDVDGNGAVTVSDTLSLQKRIARVEQFSAAQEQYGDVNGDGSITTADVLLVQKYIAHSIDRFPAENPEDIEDTDPDDLTGLL